MWELLLLAEGRAGRIATKNSTFLLRKHSDTPEKCLSGFAMDSDNQANIRLKKIMGDYTMLSETINHCGQAET